MNARRLNGILATVALVVTAAVMASCSASKQQAPDIIGGPPPVGSTPPNLLLVTPTQTCGNAGNVITVTGQNLAPGGVFPGITINNVPATVLNVTSTTSGGLVVDQLTIRTPSLGGLIPAGGLQVPIRVTTANGTDTITSLRVLPACEGPPVLAQVDPGSASRVGGSPITLRGAGLGCVTQVQLIGRSGGGTFNVNVIDVSSDGEITVASPATSSQTTEFFDVRVVSDCGSSTLASAFIFTGGTGGTGPTIPNATGITPAQGPSTGGNAVTITGSNLNLVTRIRFGSVTLTLNAATNGFFIDANGQIFIPSVPASAVGAGTSIPVNVFVGTASTEDASPVVYNYIGQGAPTCATLAPLTGTTAGGTDVLITGAGLDEVDQVLFGGIAAPTLTRPSPGTLAVRTPAFPFAIPVSVEFLVNGVRILCPSAFTFQQESSDPPFEVTDITPGVGLQTGNEVITITGTGLEDVASIRICNVDISGANLLQKTDTFVRALTQPFTGAVPVTCDVVVTTIGGQSDTIIGGFTFQPPTPDGQTFIAGVNTAPASGGGNFRIQGVNLIGVEDVHFGGTQANDALACLIDVQSNTELTGVVPAYFTPGGPFPASVGVFPESSSGIDPTTVRRSDGQLFRYYANPTLTSATGEAGDLVEVGHTVTVTGTNFRPESDVFIGRVTVSNSGLVQGTSAGEDEINVQFTVLSNTSLQFSFPNVTVADFYDITIHLVGEGLPCVADYEFTLLRALIFGRDADTAVLTPDRGPYSGGTDVVITHGFTLPIDTVTIGGVSQTIVGRTATTVTIRTTGVAASAAGTALNVVVTDIGGQSTTILGGFTFIPPPTVTSASTDAPNCPGLSTPADSPLPVEQGQLVTITGDDLLNVTAAFVGDEEATIITQTLTTLTFSVPEAPSGGPRFDIAVEVEFDDPPANPEEFRRALGGAVQYQDDPVIEAITPVTGAAGSLVTITGENLANVNGDPVIVMFDNTGAAVLSASATSVVVQVPAGTPGDQAVVTVRTCMGTAAAATAFLFPCSIPNVTGISPTTGSAGTPVTLTGVNLAGPNGEAPTVTFGTAPATVTDTQPNQVIVLAPAGTLGSRVTVTLTTCGGSDTAPTTFAYGCATPTITDVQPTFGRAGTVLTISGINLNSPDGSGVTVTFGAGPGTNVTPTAVTATSITVTVPAGTGTVDVTVTNCGGADTQAGAFQYCLAPTAGAPSITQGAANTLITINGTNLLNPDGSFPTVTFGGTPGSVQTATAATLTVRTPAGLTGSQSVVVTTCGGSVISGQFLFCTPATITSITPTQGPTGTQVIINGTNLIGANGTTGTVTIGGVAAPPVAAAAQTATRLIVTVGALATGNVPVSVTTCAGTTAGPFFQVCATPSVDGVSPIDGPPGALVTISGTGLLSADGTSPVIRFGTVTVPAGDILVVTDTAIQVEAPSGFPSGTIVPVSVTTCGGTDTLAAAFEFSGTTTCSAPTVTSATPLFGPAGTLVTIIGTNLIDNNGVPGDVEFDGVDAPLVTSTPTRLVVRAPVGASGTVQITVSTCGGSANAPAPFIYCDVPTVTGVNPSQGSAGNTVIVSGTNFLGPDGLDPTVFFGVEAATVFNVNPAGTQIVVEVPEDIPEGTVVTVRVDTCGGTGSLNNAFTYACTTAPSITEVENAAGTTAPPNGNLPIPGTMLDPFIITGTNLVGADGLLPVVKFGEGTAGLLDVRPDRVTVAIPEETDAGVPFFIGDVVTVSITTCGGTDNTLPGNVLIDFIFAP